MIHSNDVQVAPTTSQNSSEDNSLDSRELIAYKPKSTQDNQKHAA